MKNYYTDSWQLYKSCTQSFDFDFEYYFNLCKGYSTLDVFAGFGRLTNYLNSKEIDIESVEMEAGFAQYIKLPTNQNHISNILEFNSVRKFERIIAGMNSFCLITDVKNILSFFNKISLLLEPGGIASLSYYHPDFWDIDQGQSIYFEHMGKTVEYFTTFDFSKRILKKATWNDHYCYENVNYTFEYPTRVYESVECLLPFLENTDLKLVEIIKNYNKTDIAYAGWVEFVLEKRK